MTPRRLMLTLLVAAVLATLLTTRILGQVRQESGHGLDANLQLGSGGYNSSGRGAVGQRNTARLYRPAYSVSRPASVRRDHYNTFLADRQYNVARSVGPYNDRAIRGTSPSFRRSRPAETFPPPPPSAGTPPPVELVPDPEQAVRLMEQISYGIGYYLGQEIAAGLERDRVDANPNDLITGFSEGLRDQEPAMSRDQIEAVLAALDVDMRDKSVTQLLAGNAAFKKLHDENLARSRVFHEAFGARDGVITLPSGLQYEVLEAGAGASPGPADTVVINIRVSNIDGTEIARWDAAEVQVHKMVDAGAQVLPLMKAGARWRTAIPPDLAYGAEGKPPAIGPNETIRADVELLEIK